MPFRVRFAGVAIVPHRMAWIARSSRAMTFMIGVALFIPAFPDRARRSRVA
jgi:hypothetical protein